ncbi:MAG: Ribosomal RNA small subunit methyltransferase B [Hyphomicrobiaceae bacterium hypho_1]
MKLGAHLTSATEVLAEILKSHRSAASTIKDWGKSHRFAGSSDRSTISNLVYDALRRKLSLAAQMQNDSPRALILATAPYTLGIAIDLITKISDGTRYAPPPLKPQELVGLRRQLSTTLPQYIRGDYPKWLAASIERAFGDNAVTQGAALARRAPIDLRTNALKADREQVLKALKSLNAVKGNYAPFAVRVQSPNALGRIPNLEAETSYVKGWFEIQDEGSQIAAALASASPNLQVLDLCAGSGGKTLALAGTMQNTGKVFAFDTNKHQLQPIFKRIQRAGVRNIRVLKAADIATLNNLGPCFDIVFVDAPCSGSGVWRRRPDTKWRIKPTNLVSRISEQKTALTVAQKLVKPGGYLLYVTCSILPEENIDQVAWFLKKAPNFILTPYLANWCKVSNNDAPLSADKSLQTLQLTPSSHGTDGFFIAKFQRQRV